MAAVICYSTHAFVHFSAINNTARAQADRAGQSQAGRKEDLGPYSGQDRTLAMLLAVPQDMQHSRCVGTHGNLSRADQRSKQKRVQVSMSLAICLL